MTNYNANININFRSLGYQILMISMAISIASPAQAGCSCSVGNWDPSAFLNSEDTILTAQAGSKQDAAADSSGEKGNAELERIAAFPGGSMLKSLKSVSSSDVVIDVSEGDSYMTSHIKNAIHIPNSEFLNAEGNLKTDEELASVIGDAGVSKDDALVLYGSKESSGEAEFAFLVLKYLGHKDVTLLDGSLEDWNAAGLPNETAENKLPSTDYAPSVASGIIADYDYVLSGQAQIIDARPFSEFGKGRISGSIAFDPSNVIKADRIKDKEGLSTVFSRLEKDMPIVVYSDDYTRSSLVWFALLLMEYDASVYTWQDWKAHDAADNSAAAGQSQSNAVQTAADQTEADQSSGSQSDANGAGDAA